MAHLPGKITVVVEVFSNLTMAESYANEHRKNYINLYIEAHEVRV